VKGQWGTWWIFLVLSWMGSDSRRNLGDHAVWSFCFMEYAAQNLQCRPQCTVRTVNSSQAAMNAFNGTTHL